MSAKAARRRPPPPQPRRRVDVRAVVGVIIAVGVIVAIALVAFRGGSDESPAAVVPSCGWDLSTPDGVQANREYLEQAAYWMLDQPAGSIPDPPTSPYWHGECPVPTDQPSGPPLHEDDP